MNLGLVLVTLTGCLGLTSSAKPSSTPDRTTLQIETNLLSEEVFGPSSLVIGCESSEEMQGLAEHLEGQLSATLHVDASDYELARRMLPVLERKAGRIVFNGFPTGVEVCHAMVHGGPFPATSDSRTTSVGAAAIERFLRPVCYQDMPEALRTASLQDDNPLSLWRLRDGQYGRR